MNFQPTAQLSGLLNTKIISLAIVLVAVTAICSFSLTGNVTQQEQNRTLTELLTCQNTLNSTVDNLGTTTNDLTAATDALSSCQSDLQAAQSDVSACADEKEELSSDVDACISEKEQFEADAQNYLDSYEELAQNAARSICCTPGLESTDWDVLNDEIICMGSETVDCIE